MGPMSMRTALGTFSGKRVLLTGHTGFKGSWLAFLLTELGAEVMGCALPPEQGDSHFKALNLASVMTHVELDVRDADAVRTAMQSFQPEYVIHLAAQAIVRRSYDDPVATFATNVMGSVNVLEAVRHCDAVRSAVMVTSDKCYENVEWVWGYRENDRLGGRDPYSASKAAAEIASAAYFQSYFADGRLGAATARAGNVIGGGDWAQDRIIPDCVRAAMRHERVHLRNPLATRPWQHVLEPLSGYLMLAAQLRKDPVAYSGAWNFGPSTSEVRTVEQVAQTIATAFDLGSPVISPPADNPHEAQLLQLNCDKARQLLGWEPRWTVDEAVHATAEWYRSVLRDRQDARDVTKAQIHEYFPALG